MTTPRTSDFGFGGDAYPGEQPQYQNDGDRGRWNDRMQHDEPDYEPGTATYNLFYGNGQLHVSPEDRHDHDTLRGHAGLRGDHQGPIAVGNVHVERGRATFAVEANVSLRGLHRVFKEYAKQVGWRWGGLTDLDGEPFDDDFAPKKSLFLQDNASGERTPFVTRGRTAFVHGLDEQQQQAVRSLGYKLAEVPGGGNFMDTIKRVEDLQEYNLYDPNPDPNKHEDLEQPAGSFRCPDCGKVESNWQAYVDHRADERNEHLIEPTQDGKFPEAPDMDKTLPNNFVDRQPYIMPLASWKEAARVEGFDLYAGLWGYDNDDHKHYGAFLQGEPVGYASVRETERGAEVVMVHSAVPNRGVGRALASALQIHYRELTTSSATEGGARLARKLGMAATGGQTYKWSADAQPKDVIDSPIPFVYDVENDNIAVGQPGTRHSDIPGQFTPGGIVEGSYEPGGKVVLHTMTNMPYTVRHMLELWYAMHPHMEITGVEMHDANGQRTKLAKASGRSYERVTFTDGKTVLLRIDSETPDLLNGTEVKKDGDEVVPKGVDGDGNRFTDRSHMIQKSMIRARTPMVMNFTYGLLEPAVQSKVAAQDVGAYIKQIAMIDPAVHQAYNALKEAGGNVYVVGGAVRDALLQQEPKDIDLMVTGIPSEKVNHILSGLPGRVDLTGKSFGVYRYKSRGGEVEIALPRTETSTGDRRVDFAVDVDHTLPVESDLRRRDFTVNSMAVDLASGHLVDPYGGAKDLEERTLRTTHPNSFKEDPTRLLRALVMNSRYGLHPDEPTRQQMTENAHRIPLESADAKQGILEKLFAAKKPARGIRLAHETGMLQHIFPEVEHAWDFNQNNPHHNLPLGEHLVNVLDNLSERTSDPDLRVAGLLHDIGKPASAWVNPVTGSNHYYKGPNGEGDDHEIVGATMAEERLRALRWPSARVKRVKHLIEHHMWPAFGSAKGARKFIHRVGDDHADDLLTFRWADQRGKGVSKEQLENRTHIDKQRGLVEQARSVQAPTSLSALAINGNDILALGVTPGPALGRILRQLTDDVVEDPALNDRAVLLQRAKEYADAIPH